MFKVPFVAPIQLNEIQSLHKDSSGRKYQQVKVKQRTAIVKLRLYEGSGKIEIKSSDGVFNIMYFQAITQREQVLFPFKVIDRVNKFDMYVDVNNTGMSITAKAIRYAVSKALCSFIGADSIEKLRLGIFILGFVYYRLLWTFKNVIFWFI